MPCRARKAISSTMFWERPDRIEPDQEDHDRRAGRSSCGRRGRRASPQRRRDGRGQQVGRHHPGQVVQAVQVAGDGRAAPSTRSSGRATARNMPSMSAPRITRIRRCSAVSKSWSPGAGEARRCQRHGRPPCRAPTRSRSGPSSARNEPGPRRPSPRAAGRARPAGPSAPVRGSSARRGSGAMREARPSSGSAWRTHEPVSLELLDLARHRRGVDVEHLGQRRHPEGVAVDMELVEQRPPRPGRGGPRPTATGARASAPG